MQTTNETDTPEQASKADLTVVIDDAEAPPAAPDAKRAAGGKSKAEIVQALKQGAVLKSLPLENIITGEQPRKFFEAAKLQELADSIASVGVQQPPLVRPLPDGMFQIVVGERRCRAAKKAGLEEILALVREIDDQDVLDAQIAENLHRVDLSAVEEGAAYERMTRPVSEGGLGREVDEVAARVQRSKSWVYGRMKLTEICPEGMRALEKGQISASVAEAVARIVDPARQAAATKDLVEMRAPADREEDRDPVTLRRALEHIRNNYMLDLARAPFDRKDMMLVAEAGPCTSCPFNSANQPGDLFASRSRPHCLKPACYAQKVVAHWDAQKQKALAGEKPPAKVLTLKQGKELYANGTLSHTAAFVELDAVCHEDTQKAKRTWRKLLGDSCPPVTLAPDQNAVPHELVDATAALAALKQQGHKFAGKAQERARKKPSKAEQDALDTEEAIREQSRSALIAEAVDVTQRNGLSLGAQRLVARQMLNLGGWAGIAERRGIEGGIDGCQRKIDKMSEHEVRGFMVEMALVEHLNTAEGDDLRPVSRELGLNIKDIEARVRLAVEAAVRAEEKANAPDPDTLKARKAKSKRKE